MRYLMAALLMPLAACSVHANGDEGGPGVTGTGSGTTRTFAVADFSAIDLRGSDDIDVRVGTGFSVRAEGPSDDLDHLRIVREGDTLKVGRKNGSGFNWGKGEKVKVFVTLPRLAEGNVSGSGDMTVDRVEGSKFESGIAGSGSLNVAALQVDSAEFSIAGSGDVKTAGTAKSLKISIAGAGDVAAAGLTARSADISIAGSGSVRAAVDGQAKIDIMGSGDVDLGPKARCQTSKMGSGSVRCGG